MFRVTRSKGPGEPATPSSGVPVQRADDGPHHMRRNVPGTPGYRRPENTPLEVQPGAPVVLEAPASVGVLLAYARDIGHHRVEQIEQAIRAAANQAAMVMRRDGVEPVEVVHHERAKGSPRQWLEVHAHLRMDTDKHNPLRYVASADAAHRAYQEVLRGHLQAVGFRSSMVEDSPHRWELDGFLPDPDEGDVVRCGGDPAAIYPLERGQGGQFRPLGRVLESERDKSGDVPALFADLRRRT